MSRTTRGRWGILICLVAVGTSGAWAEEGEPVAPSFPLTVEPIKFRNKKKTYAGDLTITTEAMEFRARKRTIIIPLGTIRMVSFGRMKGDVDTDWVVFSVAEEEGKRLIGVRDGRRFGFSKQSGKTFEMLKAAFRELSIAQYDTPDGWKTFDELDLQFTLAIPEGWDRYHHSAFHVDGRPIWGSVLFTAEPVENLASTTQGQVLDTKETGLGITSFFVDRREVVKGMRCANAGRAETALLEWVAEDPLFGEGFEAIDAPRAEPTTVDGCEALRIRGRSRAHDGREAVVDVYAFSDDETIFLVGTRAWDDQYEDSRTVLESVLETFLLVDALKGRIPELMPPR